MSIADVLLGKVWESKGEIDNTDNNKIGYYPSRGEKFEFKEINSSPEKPTPAPFEKISAAGLMEHFNFPVSPTRALKMQIDPNSYNSEYGKELTNIIFYENGEEMLGQIIKLQAGLMVSNVIAVGTDSIGLYMEMRSYWDDKDVGRYICRHP